MPLPSLVAIAIGEGTFQQGVENNPPPPPAMLDQNKPGRIRVKNGDAFAKKNYMPITVLPAISKIYERTFSGQIARYMENILSPYLCAYRKGYNTKHALLRLIEKCRSFLDMKGFAGAILMDLSKAFDCLNH